MEIVFRKINLSAERNVSSSLLGRFGLGSDETRKRNSSGPREATIIPGFYLSIGRRHSRNIFAMSYFGHFYLANRDSRRLALSDAPGFARRAAEVHEKHRECFWHFDDQK